ncbi:MAG: hypothetical protein AB1609_02500 [Bacillota bacterium]
MAVRDLVAGYGGALAVDGISLGAGEIVAVMGPSSAGGSPRAL